VAVITSLSGAALQDMLRVLGERDPSIEVLIVPSLVQGPGAAESLARALERVNRPEVRLAPGRRPIEAVILGRGGGSLEDLWPFNEEVLARAVYASTLPVISAVGHEIDFTISDFTADYRAPTPTAAAELVSAGRPERLSALGHLQSRLLTATFADLEGTEQMLLDLAERLPDPRRAVLDSMIRLDDLFDRGRRALLNSMALTGQQLEHYHRSLSGLDPRRLNSLQADRLRTLAERLERAARTGLDRRSQNLASLETGLFALSPGEPWSGATPSCATRRAGWSGKRRRPRWEMSWRSCSSRAASVSAWMKSCREKTHEHPAPRKHRASAFLAPILLCLGLMAASPDPVRRPSRTGPCRLRRRPRSRGPDGPGGPGSGRRAVVIRQGQCSCGGPDPERIVASVSAGFRNVKIPCLPVAAGIFWQGWARPKQEQAPGSYDLTFRIETTLGETETRSVPVTVMAEDYPSERLTVDPSKVTVPPEYKQRVAADRAAFRRTWAHRPGAASGAVRSSGPVRAGSPLLTATGGSTTGRCRAPTGGWTWPRTRGTDPGDRRGQGGAGAQELHRGRDRGGGPRRRDLLLLLPLSAFQVTEGQMVERDEVVGLAGATGRVTGPTSTGDSGSRAPGPTPSPCSNSTRGWRSKPNNLRPERMISPVTHLWAVLDPDMIEG